MFPSNDAPHHTDVVDVDEVVSISMLESVVVVRPTGRPGALGTRVIADVINAATEAETTVVLHRAGSDIESDAWTDDATDTPSRPVPARPITAGTIDLRTESGIWTIDIESSTFIRSDRPIDRLFTDTTNWTPFEALWIGPTLTGVLTAEGTLVAGRRAQLPPMSLGRRGDWRSLRRTA